MGLFVSPLAAFAQVPPPRARQQRPQPPPAGRVVVPVRPAAPAAGELASTVAVGDVDVDALAARLAEFRGGLADDERAAFDLLLLRASTAPPDDRDGTHVRTRLFTGDRPGAEGEGPAGVIVQGGREQQTPGGLRASPVAVLREALGPGVVSIGPKQDDPRSPQGTEAIGPKQDDPRAPAASTGVLAIGPKQDDPRSPASSLAGKMQEFGGGLSVTEKVMMDWLLQRAAAAAAQPSSTPGGLPPSPAQALRAALGMEAIGPKQDDPAPAPDHKRWVLRF